MTISFQIPDALLQKAEIAARAKGLSRDQIVVTALTQYLARQEKPSMIRAQLDELYSIEASTLEPGLARLQAKSLPKEA